MFELFKYLPPERTDVLRNLRIRYTQVSALNDPFESFPGVRLENRAWYMKYFKARVIAEMDSLGIRSENKRKKHWRDRKKEFDNFHKCYTDSDWLLSVCEEIQHMADTVQGCLSLSATATNILMWSHYATNHTGYFLAFDASHEYFGKSVAPVEYTNRRPLHHPFRDYHSGEILYTKSPDWSYEQEYRKYQGFVDPIELSNENSLLPYKEEAADGRPNDSIVLFPFPKAAISSVIIGWKASSKMTAELLSCLERHGINEVPVYRAVPSLSEYKMEFERYIAT